MDIKGMHRACLPVVAALAACFVAAFFCACGQKESGKGQSSERNFDEMFDRVVTSETDSGAMRHIRQASEEGRISYGQQRYLEAMVVYRGFMHFDSVLTICRPLADLPEVKADKSLSYRIYALMTNAAASSANYADMIQYASRTVVLTKALGKIDKEQEMRGTVGYGMVLLGREREGLQMMDNALGVLEKRSEWNCMNSWLILSKLKIAALDFVKRHEDMLGVCDAVVGKLDYMQDNPNAITKKPEGWNADHKAFVAAIDLYRSQMYAYMAYANARCGRRKEALQSLALFDKTGYSKSVDAQRMIVSALCELGLYRRMLAAYSDIDRQNGADTLNDTYGEELKAKSKAASAGGDEVLARAYLWRAVSLEDTLARMRDMDQMARTLSVYKVHEEQMKASKASFTAKIMVVVAVALFLVALMAVLLMARAARQNRVTKMKNKILVRNIEAAYSYRDKYESLLKAVDGNGNGDARENVASTDEDSETCDNAVRTDDTYRLFTLIDRTIRGEQMFLNVDFQRQTLVEKLNVDRNRIGRAIRECSGYSNLSAYINSFRLEYAYRMLRQPDSKTTIDNVAKLSGFSTVRTFQRLFKEKYGMTPVEFRESVE